MNDSDRKNLDLTFEPKSLQSQLEKEYEYFRTHPMAPLAPDRALHRAVKRLLRLDEGERLPPYYWPALEAASLVLGIVVEVPDVLPVSDIIDGHTPEYFDDLPMHRRRS